MLSSIYSFLLIFVIFTINFLVNYIYLFLTDKDIVKMKFINNKMGTLLILFGVLKLANLSKFVEIFSKYDIISQKFKIYGYLFPFIEIIIGILLIKGYKLNYIYNLIKTLMIISIISVSISIIQGKKLRCGCLGSFFHIPLSYITIFENIYMLVMINMIKI